MNVRDQIVASRSEWEARGSEVVDELRGLGIPVLIWGHPAGSHTHSWIHYGFARAFEHLGFEVLWFEDSARSAARVSDLERAVVLTEGQQDRYLSSAVNRKWLVFGHNCQPELYRGAAHLVPFQVLMLDKSGYRNPKWHPEVANEEPAPSSTESHRDEQMDTAEILWATDLLPHEITFTPHRVDSRDVAYVGSVWAYNRAALKRFRRAIRSHGLKWRVYRNVDQRRHECLIRGARFAPSIQGDWQVDHGYIPCRLFKNVSYSQLAVSNNPSASKILGDDQMVCDRDLDSLVDRMLEAERLGRIDEMVRSAQSTVRSRHTYLNRVNELIGFAAATHPDALGALIRRPARSPRE